MKTALNDGLSTIAEFVPKLVAFLLILVIGLIVAKLISKALSGLLEKVGFDRAVERGGVKRALAQSSLDASDKAGSWSTRADYNLERMMAHGLRRADEMAEVAKTLEGLGIEPLMTSGTVRRQREIGSIGVRQPEAGIAAKVAQLQPRKDAAA